MNTSPSIPLPVEPRPKRPAAISPLIDYDSNPGRQEFYYSQPQTTPSPTYLPPYSAFADASEEEYTKFLKEYPRMYICNDSSHNAHVPTEYMKTMIVDELRESEYTRLKHTGETYVDYTGGGLYPEKLPKQHLEFLTTNVLGNTHSVNNR